MALVWSGLQDYVPTVTSFSRHEENITHLFDIILAVELVLINIRVAYMVASVLCHVQD